MIAYLRALKDAGGLVYEVGGTVRDRLMGHPSKDRDYIVCGLSIKQIEQILKPFGKLAEVGRSFGVLKFTPHVHPEQTIDISLPRREKSTGVGHRDFEVDFDPKLPVEKDLGRRDFTMNAMAMNVETGEITDPFGGQKDLEAGLLRQVFDRSFEEDPLRLLRAIQFAARFELKIEKKTREAMKTHAHLIETVSAERISEELRKLFLAHRPSVGFELMNECGLLTHILPEVAAIKGIEQDKQPGDDVYGHTMRALDAARSDHAILNRGNLELMFAVLLHDIGKAKTSRYHEPSKRVVFFGHQIVSAKMARHIAKRLKLETIGVNPKNITRLIENHMFETKAFFSDRAIRRFVNKVGKDRIFMLIDLRLADNRGGKHPHGIKGVEKLRGRIQEELDKKPPFGPADLAIDGHDVMELDVPEGPLIGAILGELVEIVLDDPDLNTREQLLALAGNLRQNPAEVIERWKKRRSESEKTSSQPPEDAGREGRPHR